MVRPNETPKLVTRLLEEDIQRIVEGLNICTKDEHTTLVMGVE